VGGEIKKKVGKKVYFGAKLSYLFDSPWRLFFSIYYFWNDSRIGCTRVFRRIFSKIWLKIAKYNSPGVTTQLYLWHNRLARLKNGVKDKREDYFNNIFRTKFDGMIMIGCFGMKDLDLNSNSKFKISKRSKWTRSPRDPKNSDAVFLVGTDFGIRWQPGVKCFSYNF